MLSSTACRGHEGRALRMNTKVCQAARLVPLASTRPLHAPGGPAPLHSRQVSERSCCLLPAASAACASRAQACLLVACPGLACSLVWDAVRRPGGVGCQDAGQKRGVPPAQAGPLGPPVDACKGGLYVQRKQELRLRKLCGRGRQAGSSQQPAGQPAGRQAACTASSMWALSAPAAGTPARQPAAQHALQLRSPGLSSALDTPATLSGAGTANSL